MKNLGARRMRTKQDGDGRDAPASSEKSNPCASRSSGTSSSASSCDGDETDAKAFDAAESGGEASRQIPRVNRLLFARDLVVACDVAARGPSRTTRGDAPARPSKAATIRCRPWKRACSAPLCSPRTSSRGGLLRARPFTVTRWHASFTSDKLSFVVATRLVHWSTRGNVYIKRANRKQTRRGDDALVQERLLHLPHGLRDDRHGFVHLCLAHDERRQEPRHVSRAGGDHQQTRVPADRRRADRRGRRVVRRLTNPIREPRRRARRLLTLPAARPEAAPPAPRRSA